MSLAIGHEQNSAKTFDSYLSFSIIFDRRGKIDIGR